MHQKLLTSKHFRTRKKLGQDSKYILFLENVPTKKWGIPRGYSKGYSSKITQTFRLITSQLILHHVLLAKQQKGLTSIRCFSNLLVGLEIVIYYLIKCCAWTLIHSDITNLYLMQRRRFVSTRFTRYLVRNI